MLIACFITILQIIPWQVQYKTLAVRSRMSFLLHVTDVTRFLQTADILDQSQNSH